jgi:hypothetical protein
LRKKEAKVARKQNSDDDGLYIDTDGEELKEKGESEVGTLH